jgi:UrcA family protein
MAAGRSARIPGVGSNERGLAMTSLFQKRLVLVVLVLSSMAVTALPASAQRSTPRWSPRVESITVTAGAMKNWRAALSASHLGRAFAVSASIPVPYADLDLVKDEDASELGRRVHVAARLVCQEMDSKYPPNQYPIIEGYSGQECVRVTARDSMEEANMVIARAKR